MPIKPLSREMAEEAVAEYQKARAALPKAYNQEVLALAGQALGLTEKGIATRLKVAAERYGLRPSDERVPKLPELPDPELPVDETIDQLCSRFEKRHARAKAERWMRIQMPDDQPFALCFWGDPHLDNPGTNWPLLKRHAEIVAEADGMYSVCVGDLVDNWVGRLMRLYAESDISVSTGWRLVRWFFQEADLKWLITVLGNHDTWNQGGLLLREIARNVVHVADSDARFVLEAPNGCSWPIWVRHNFNGHSMWNSVHGMQRAAHTKEAAALYICGHLHNWALHEEESASRGHIYWLARARGYKWLDAHQTVLGHDAQDYGASIVAVCNPQASQMPGRMRCFPDVEEAAEFLRYLRAKHGKSQPSPEPPKPKPPKRAGPADRNSRKAA